MRIRWKLMVLLLAIALAPTITAGLIGRRAGRAMGGEITDEIAGMLVSSAEEQLQRIVERAVAMLERDRAIIETAVDIQAEAAERLLAGGRIVPGRAYLAGEFDLAPEAVDAPDVPPGLVLSVRHGRYDEAGMLRPMPVSYDVSSIRLSPGVEPHITADDIAMLASMTDIYAFVHERHPDLIRWQYTSLQTGVQSAYPGHGGYPPEYDGRTRPWYLLSRAAGGPIWAPPIIDASTRQVVLTRAAPIARPDGDIAGVTAIDVPMTQIVQRLELPHDWQSGAKVTLALLLGGGEPALTVVAQQAYTTADREWNMPVELEVLRSEDGEPFGELIDHIRRGEPVLRRMRYDGRDCLWAAGPINTDRGLARDDAAPVAGVGAGVGAGALIIIVPFEVILARVALAEGTVRARLDEQVRFTGALLAGSIAVVAVIAFLASRMVTRPVRELAETARQVADGDLEARAAVTTHDEIGELARTFNDMVPHLQERLKLKESLALAMEVQQHLLPREAPSVPGLDVAGRSDYCDETGGDYFDFLHIQGLGPRTLGVAIGDVTGHGIAAALLMTTARAMLRVRAPQPGDVAAVMTDMNRQLAADTPAGKFMTFCYLVLDARERTARWVSAGHDPAIVYDPGTDSFDELTGRDVPLGVDDTWTFTEQQRGGFKSDQIVVLGTDGIWEARNDRDEMFGKERLREVIRANAARKANEIADAVTKAVEVFRGGMAQLDDITLIVVKWE